MELVRSGLFWSLKQGAEEGERFTLLHFLKVEITLNISTFKQNWQYLVRCGNVRYKNVLIQKRNSALTTPLDLKHYRYASSFICSKLATVLTLNAHIKLYVIRVQKPSFTENKTT